ELDLVQAAQVIPPVNRHALFLLCPFALQPFSASCVLVYASRRRVEGRRGKGETRRGDSPAGSLERLVPNPIPGRLECAMRIVFDDGGEVALLAVAVHEKSRGDQRARDSPGGRRGERLSRTGCTMPLRHLNSVVLSK